MARFKNVDWILPDAYGPEHNQHSWESIHTALLMDIRDELKALNRVLSCTGFLDIPRKLERIERNTRKKTKPKTQLKRVA